MAGVSDILYHDKFSYKTVVGEITLYKRYCSISIDNDDSFDPDCLNPRDLEQFVSLFDDRSKIIDTLVNTAVIPEMSEKPGGCQYGVLFHAHGPFVKAFLSNKDSYKKIQLGPFYMFQC